MERFTVTLTKARRDTTALIEKAAGEIYRAALLHRVAVLTCVPRGLGSVPRSVVVMDCQEEGAYVDRIAHDHPSRLVGIYALAGRTHRELLNDITEDLEEIARGMA